MRTRFGRSTVMAIVAALSLGASWGGPDPAGANPYNSIGLQWIATGDDGYDGRASGYALRYRTVPVSGTDTLAWWNAATAATGLPTPAPSGSIDSTRVTGLTPGTTYWFIIRAFDEAWNMSGFSNVASGATWACDAPAASPDPVDATQDSTGIRVTWAASADPRTVGVSVYRGVGASSPLVLWRSLPASATETLDMQTSGGTTYRYRVAYAASCGDGPSSAIVTIQRTGSAPPPEDGSPPLVSVRPNPASGPVTVSVTIPGSIPLAARLDIYDLTGRRLATLIDATLPPGAHEVTWDRIGRSGDTVAPGYYEVLGRVGGTRVRARLLLVP